MNDVKNWAAIICLASISCSVLELMAPSGKMEKVVRLVFGAFMICAIINPIIVMSKSIDLDFELSNCEKKQEYEFSKKIEDVKIDTVKKEISNLIENILNEINIQPQKIDIFMDTTEDGSISINRVKVNLKKENSDRQEEVKNMVREKLGLICEITI